MGTLSGKSRFVVTGAAGAIGYATAQVLAREGARLLLVDVQAEGLAARERELAATGAEVASCRADVSRSADVQGYVAAALVTTAASTGCSITPASRDTSRRPGSTTRRSSTASRAST